MKKLSKQFKKTLSMVIAVAIIMSVCAVSFGTFGNAYTVIEDPVIGGTYNLDFADSSTYDSTAGGNLITMNTTQNTASITIDINGTRTRVLNKGYYGDPGAYMIDLIDKDVNLGSTDGHIVIEPGKTYDINIKVGRYADATHPNSNGNLYLSLAFVDESGKVFLATPLRADLANPSYNNDETWMMFAGGASSALYSLVATIDGDAVQQTVGKAYANCKLAVLCDVQPSKSGTVIVKNGTITVTPKNEGIETDLGVYNFDLSDSAGYDAATGRVVLDAKVLGNPEYTAVTDGKRWFSFDYYGKPTIKSVLELKDKDYSLGSADGSITIEAGTTYDISLPIGFSCASNHYIRAALALQDAQGNYFFLEEGSASAIPAKYSPGTWASFSGTVDGYMLKATIDGDGSRTIAGTEHKFAGCKLVVIAYGQPWQAGSLYVYGASIIASDKDKVDEFTVNYADDETGATDYSTSGGTGTSPDSNNPLAVIPGGWCKPYYAGSDNFRFCFAGANHTNEANAQANKIVDGVYYPNPEYSTNLYEYIYIADPDLKADNNEYGKVVIESGKKYVVTTTAYINSEGEATYDRWVAFGLRNPDNGSVYVLPYELATYAHYDGGVDAKQIPYVLTATIDSAALGVDDIPYAGRELVLIGGGMRKSTEYVVRNTKVLSTESEDVVSSTYKHYDYMDANRGNFYDDFGANDKTLWANSNGQNCYILNDSTSSGHNALINPIFVSNPSSTNHSILTEGVYYPNMNFKGTNVPNIVLSDPDYATADNTYGTVKIEYGKSYKIDLEVAMSGYKKPSTENSITNRWATVALRNPETKEVILVQDSQYALFNEANTTKKAISAVIDTTKLGVNNTPYVGLEVVVVYGGQYGEGTVRVWNAIVVEYTNTDAVNQGGGVAIRPEIDSDGYNSEHYIDYTEGAAEGTYGYQSAAIRFDYLVADVVIANATSGGFKVVPVASKDLLGKTNWANVTGAVDSGDLIGENKKYADGDDYDIYAVTITGLTREGVDKDLCQIYFDVCFYYTVNGKTIYVPVEYVANSYKDTYSKYAELDAAGQFDTDVYGQLKWFNRGY